MADTVEFDELLANFGEISANCRDHCSLKGDRKRFVYRGDTVMEALVQALLFWISQNSHYDTGDIVFPTVIIMSPTQITTEFYGERTDLIPEGGIDSRIWALYDRESKSNGTIYIRSNGNGAIKTAEAKQQWASNYSLEDPIFQERLLHELIHHVQYQSGAVEQFPCPAYAEKEAYMMGGVFLKKRFMDDPMPNRNFWAHVYSRC